MNDERSAAELIRFCNAIYTNFDIPEVIKLKEYKALKERGIILFPRPFSYIFKRFFVFYDLETFEYLRQQNRLWKEYKDQKNYQLSDKIRDHLKHFYDWDVNKNEQEF